MVCNRSCGTHDGVLQSAALRISPVVTPAMEAAVAAALQTVNMAVSIPAFSRKVSGYGA